MQSATASFFTPVPTEMITGYRLIGVNILGLIGLYLEVMCFVISE